MKDIAKILRICLVNKFNVPLRIRSSRSFIIKDVPNIKSTCSIEGFDLLHCHINAKIFGFSLNKMTAGNKL